MAKGKEFLKQLAGTPTNFDDKSILGAQEAAKSLAKRSNSTSLPAAPTPGVRERVLSGLLSLQGGLQAARGAGSVPGAFLSGFAGGAGAPSPEQLTQARVKQETEAAMGALDALPLREASPALADAYPDLADLPLAHFPKIAPILERTDKLEQAMRQFQIAEEGRNARAELGADAKAAEKQAKLDAETSKKQASLDSTFALYETARDGLISGLEGTATGPIVGKLPALTSEQQTAEGAMASMAPVLKQLFRVAGEGVFTDRDQELLLKMIPKRTDTPQARANMVRNIDAIVKAKLGQGVKQSAQAPTLNITPSALERLKRKAGQ